MMGPLSNAKQEKFCQNLAKGMSQDEAYTLAGYKPHQSNAARLSGNDMVRARLTELQERAAEIAVVTAADIARQLDEDREFAISLGKPSAAVSATMGKAKVLGILNETPNLNLTISPSLAHFYGQTGGGDA